ERRGPRGRPGNCVALRVSDGDHGIVKRGGDMRDARSDVFTFASADACGFLTHPKSFRAPCAAIGARLILLSSRSRGLLLTGNSLSRALPGPSVGMSTLPADRQALAMAQAAVATKIHQPFDVQLNFSAQIAFDHVVAVDDFADLEHLGVRQLRHPTLRRQINLAHDILGNLGPDAMDILQRYNDALVGGQIDARDTSHLVSPYIPRTRNAPNLSIP